MGAPTDKICYVLGVRLRRILVLCLLCADAYASSRPYTWSVARNQHFQVYSQAGAETARSALLRFEQLRAFFIQNGLLGSKLKARNRPAVRVIGFRSEKEYDAFRLRATADAFYVGTEHQDYIVMPALTPRLFGLAAHEYAHQVLYSSGLRLPPWLNEGLAEFFSTVRITDSDCELGAGLPMRMETLRHHAWLPVPDLLTIEQPSLALRTRDEMAIFYAESWALTHMLVSSPDYAPHFSGFVAALNAGEASMHALTTTYAKPLESIVKDLQSWSRQREFVPVTLPALPAAEPAVQFSEPADSQASELMADVLLADGELGRAETVYRDLARQTPENANAFAALGTIALRRGDRVEAEQRWKEAIDTGVTDAGLLYRYAVLGEEDGMPQGEIRRTLERAVALEPEFDDARYKLALLEGNAGEYAAALENLRLMPNPSTERAFAYWSATANALTELNQRDEAERAAKNALEWARTDRERTLASQLAYVAQIDLTVQFAEDANGQERLITTRVPHGVSDFNPFIDPKDHIRRAEGTLQEVRCGGGQLTGFTIDAENRVLTLAVPDPLHVLMRNGPAEFTCGPQPARSVRIEYAAAPSTTEAGVLRGMEFR